MSTIYTLNGKVLKNSANDKWLKKFFPPPFDYVTIGSQIWASENLAINDGHGGIYTQTVNHGQGNVTEYYYTWEAAVRVAATVQGWHLPTRAEWDTLVSAINGQSDAGTKLKSTYGWTSGNGTDNYGFTALPDGWRNPTYGWFSDLGKFAYFWEASEFDADTADECYMDTGSRVRFGVGTKTSALSVRLIKDA